MRKLTWLLPVTLTLLLVLAATVSVSAQDDLEVTDLSISPNSVAVGETVTISANVTNTKATEETYQLELKLNGEVEDSQDLTLGAGESDTVTFTITADTPGDYFVELGNASDLLTVKATSFLDMFAPWVWWTIGAIIGVLILLVIIIALMPSRKKQPGTVTQGRQGQPSAQAGAPFPMQEQFQTPGTFPAPGQFPAPAPMTTQYPQYARRPIFSMSNLTITPNQVKAGDPVTISAIASNNGSEAGTYSVVLRINGMVENIIDLMLSPGASQATTFTLIKDIGGEYYTEIDGLSGVFIVIPLVPANFSVSNLVISPERAKQGENIIISAIVTNNGELPGNYSAALRLKGAVESTEDIDLGPGESRKLAFKIAKTAPGFYNVELEGLTGRFVIEMEWQG
ncbi:MAG: hypothetical protein A2Z36_01150 [Chloroflexi bacterium RBG_19FT_COMBO_48_23]|nr:MAG: hypothetical protein A2Z36_01150 [Chloroflexi bacterium RBG_19FT_COMBO_48_23]